MWQGMIEHSGMRPYTRTLILKMDRPLIALDTETANSKGAPHLLELAAVRVIDGEIEDSFNSLVCPSIPIDPEAEAIHGIDEDAIRTAPETADVLNKFTEWVGDDWMVAHNAGADTRVLGFAYRRFGVDEMPEGPVLDSLALSQRYMPEAPDHKLATLSEELMLEDVGHHRALPDAVTCWKVVEACLERRGGLDDTSMTEVMTELGRPRTIPARVPDAPKLRSGIRRLRQAAQDGDEVELLYGDNNSQPSRLRLRPNFLYERHGRGYMEAECPSSGLLKTYLLARVRRLL
ncbi:MAG: DNA polymerase III epsilon subunit family exonuclease [Planctomycetota bacterium]|jgi:DNA polymerase III epsilon subunit family exonuclease